MSGERPDAEERGDEEAAAARLEAALAERELADPRPLYRELLKELRDEDPEAYEEAVERYREEVVPVATGGDPLDAWIGYGRWLASRLARGSVIAVDRSGRSEEAPEGAPPPTTLLLHLPEDTGRRAITLAVPSHPTEHQEQTRELLC